MQLTREAIQRMVGTGGMVMGGGGGEGGGISADFLTQNYVAIPYFTQLFTIHGKQTTTVDGEVTDEQDITLPPNTMPSRQETTEGGVTTVVETTITRIEALFDFNSVGGVSALGYNPGGGGGGGADLNALLDNINSSNIGDIAPTASEVGKCLVYNGNNQWAWATPGGGGGGIDNISVSSTGLLTGGSVSGSSIILNTRTIQASDLPDLSATYVKWTNVNRTSYSSWDKIPFVNAGGSMDIGKTLEFHSSDGDSTDYNAVLMLDSSKTYNTVALTLPNTSGTLATQSWVNSQGFVKSSGVTSVALSMPTGFSVTDSPVTSSGTLQVSFASGYSLPTTANQSNWNTAYNQRHTHSNKSVLDGITSTDVSHWNTAYGWGNHADAGYMQNVKGMIFTARTNYIAARMVLADGYTYDSTRAALAQGNGYIEWWSDGGFFNHWVGNVIIGQDATDTSHYIQIGGGRIYWDNQSKSLYVVQSDGSTPANIYATGGVSSLGISTGGSPSVSALTVGTLTASSQLNVGGTSSFTGAMTVNAMTINGNLSATNWQIPTTGYARFARLYLDSTRYVYVSSGHLYFYNGSSSVQIV